MAYLQPPAPHERSVRDEAEWIPNSIDDLAGVIALLDDRYGRAGLGVADWLVRKATGWPDPTSSAMRAKYRRMLRALRDEHVS